jgi:hypothetical protein
VVEKRIEYAPRAEVDSRSREVQILVNLAQPDPDMQPVFLSDESTLLDFVVESIPLVEARLEAYLSRPLPLPISAHIWKLVDAIKQACPGWPDDWPPTPN